MIKIYADENAKDELDRYVLSIAGSRKYIERYGDQIREGIEVTLNVQDEFEVKARLIFDRVWLAIPDMTSIKYLNAEDEPE